MLTVKQLREIRQWLGALTSTERQAIADVLARAQDTRAAWRGLEIERDLNSLLLEQVVAALATLKDVRHGR